MKYIYVASHGRSGSTLLELLLNRQPQITALGEIEKLNLQFARDEHGKYPGRCSCGAHPAECDIWSKALEGFTNQFGATFAKNPFCFRVSDIGLEEDWGKRALGHWMFRKVHRASRYLGYRGTLGPMLKGPLTYNGAQWFRNRHTIAEAVASLTKASVVVDSSKDYLGMRDAYDYGSGSTKVVFLTRDVRGNVWSALKGQEKGEGDVRRAAREWLLVNKRILLMLQGIPREDWLHVKYEDLCAHPPAVCEAICSLAGCNFSESALGNGAEQHHTIGGNKIRHGRVDAIRQDLDWKGRFTTREIGEIKRVAGSLAEQLGYSL